MRRWFVGFNDYWFTANIYLEETPIGLCFLEWLVLWICYFIPAIKLPKIKFKLKNKEEWEWIESKDGWTDLQDWYGDLSQLWHSFICMPISDLTWRRTETKIIELPFSFALEKFPNDYTKNDYEDDEDGIKVKKNREAAEQLYKEFKEVYNKLGHKCPI